MDVKEAIEKRRNVKSWLPKDIHNDTIIELIDAARKAPSSGNLQDWKFILVKKQEQKEQIADACYQQLWLADAPVLIVVEGMIAEAKRMYGTRGEVLYMIQDCAMAAENIILRATELGLSCAIVGAFEEGMVKRLLSIPDEFRPLMVIGVGYSNETPSHKELKTLENITYFHKHRERVENYNEAFYRWSGMMEDKVKSLASKVKEGTTLTDKIKGKFKKSS